MSEAKEKKKGWFSKIESREDALKVVKDTSSGFFVVAALQAALSFLMGVLCSLRRLHLCHRWFFSAPV
jgi:cobalamin synthase